MEIKIAIRAFNGMYLSAIQGGGGELRANQKKRGDWELFTLEALSKNTVAIRTINGQYLCSDLSDNGRVTANRNNLGEWEAFTISPIYPGTIAIQSCKNKYWCAENGGGQEVIANREAQGDWESFEIEAFEPAEAPDGYALVHMGAVKLGVRILKEVIFAKSTDLDDGEREAREQRREDARREEELTKSVNAPAPVRDSDGKITRPDTNRGDIFRGDINTHPDTSRTA